MDLKKQVVSLELSKRLKELGVKQESVFRWVDITKEQEWGVVEIDYTPRLIFDNNDQWVSAFTVAELGELLPAQINEWDGENILSWINTRASMFFGTISKDEWYSNIDLRGEIVHSETATTEVDARAKMLIYLYENNLIKNS